MIDLENQKIRSITIVSFIVTEYIIFLHGGAILSRPDGITLFAPHKSYPGCYPSDSSRGVNCWRIPSGKELTTPSVASLGAEAVTSGSNVDS